MVNGLHGRCGKSSDRRVPTWSIFSSLDRMASFPGTTTRVIASSIPSRLNYFRLLFTGGAPDYTPENVARFFEQAIDNLPKNWDAAASMFRKALDTGLKSKFPEMKGTLYNRIEEAAKKQDLTPALAEWAHQIRLGGNDAAHEEEPISKNDAAELSKFTRLVFLYLFTLPGMLEEAQKRTGE